MAISSWTNVPNETPVADWTVTALTANVLLQSPTSGVDGGIGLTANSVQNTNVPTNYLWDIVSAEITSPVASDGSFPDCEIYFEVDGVKTDSIMIIDGAFDTNMFPRELLTIAGKKLVFGESLRSLLYTAMGGGNASNMAARATGFKAAQSVTMFVKSAAGWGNAAAAIVPLRVILYADVMQESDIQAIQGFWNGAVNLNIPAYDAYSVTHSPNFPISAKTWKTFPGGVGQTAVKIFKRINYAYNNQATQSGLIYRFTQKNELLGDSKNVISSNHDLGDAFFGEKTVFLWQEFGVRTTGPLYFGWEVGNVIIPNESSLNGQYITPGNNKFQYGSVSPQLTDTARYYAVRDVKNLFRAFAYNVNVVPFISTGGMSVLAANAVSVVKSGILIQQA